MENDSSAGWVVAAIIFAVAYWGSGFGDNKEAKYGEDFGLPVNCRTYVAFLHSTPESAGIRNSIFVEILYIHTTLGKFPLHQCHELNAIVREGVVFA